MIVKDLEGNESRWRVSRKDKKPRVSIYHMKAVKIIKEIWPSIRFLEEVPINVKPKIRLYLDIYIPMLHKAIEVHGQQHYEYNKKFHRTIMDFNYQKTNDRLKEEWCELNEIEYIELPFYNIDEWEDILLQ